MKVKTLGNKFQPQLKVPKSNTCLIGQAKFEFSAGGI